MNTDALNLASLKPYLLPIVTVVAVLLIVPLALLPGISGLQDRVASLQKAQDTLKAETDKADRLEKLDITTYSDQLTTNAETAMPSKSDPSGVLGTLELVASSSGVTSRGVRFTSASAM